MKLWTLFVVLRTADHLKVESENEQLIFSYKNSHFILLVFNRTRVSKISLKIVLVHCHTKFI